MRRNPLRHRAFRNQFLAQAVSMTGSALTPVAMAFGVLQATGSAADLGLVLAAYTVPMLVFMLAGGVWADRLPRQRMMMAADAVRCLTQTAFGVLLLAGHARLWEMVLLQAFAGTAAAFYLPASMGLTKATVPNELLQEANGLLALTRNVTFTVGPLVAGTIVAFVGAGWALVFDGLTFGGSVFFLSLLRLAARPAGPARSPFLAEVRGGWREVSRRTWVWLSIIYYMVFNLIFAGVQVLGPAAVSGRAHAALGWGAVAAALSGGELLGNALSVRIRPRRLLVASRYGELLAIPLLVALGLGAPVAELVVTGVLLGVAISFPDALWLTALQQHIPEAALSRVTSFDYLGSFVLRPVSYTVAAGAVAAFGTERALIVGAGGL